MSEFCSSLEAGSGTKLGRRNKFWGGEVGTGGEHRDRKESRPSGAGRVPFLDLTPVLVCDIFVESRMGSRFEMPVLGFPIG